MRDFVGLLVKKFSDGASIGRLIEQPLLVSFLNPYSYLVIRGNADIANGIDVWAFDGKAMEIAFGAAGLGRFRRASFDFTSLADPFFAAVRDQGRSLFLLGSTPDVVDKFASVVRERHPGISIIGVRSGYFDGEADYRNVIAEIASKNPDTLVCGMGALKQERLIMDLRAAGWRGFGITCGGFMHQTASSGGDYYPPLFDKLNLRFIYRMIDEPKLIKRYLLHYPMFVVKFIADCVAHRNLR